MDHVFPDRYEDYTEADYEVLEQAEERRLVELTERVYSAFCSRCYGTGDWLLSGIYGVEEIAFYAADEEQRVSLANRFDRGSDDSAWWNSHAHKANDLLYDVAAALRRLIADGRIESFMKDDWPALRPTSGWEDIARVLDDELHDERWERQTVLRTADYREYLASPEWQERRNTKLQQAGHRCELCGSENRLEVHHRTYERRGNERLSDLIALCHACHGRFHGRVEAR